MIEIIAKALYDHDCETCQVNDTPWEEVPNKTEYQSMASAVLHAIFGAGYQLFRHPYTIDWDPNPSKDPE
jgi:hypothetical protein